MKNDDTTTTGSFQPQSLQEHSHYNLILSSFQGSVIQFFAFGSSLSLRNWSRIGAHASIYASYKGGVTSIVHSMQIGSSVSLRSLIRFGSGMSILDMTHLGSGLSLRQYARLSSGVSVHGFLHPGDAGIYHLSVLTQLMIGSSLSVRRKVQFGAEVSVLGFMTLGSSLSLRNWLRLGSSLSLASKAQLPGQMSVLSHVHLGTALSVRNIARMDGRGGGGGLSNLDFSNLGSAVSLRSYVRIGSVISLMGICRFGSFHSLSVGSCVSMATDCSVTESMKIVRCLSVFDQVNLGSSLSVRSSMITVGQRLTVFDALTVGSSFSVRKWMRAGSAMSMAGKIVLPQPFSVTQSLNTGSCQSGDGTGELVYLVSESGFREPIKSVCQSPVCQTVSVKSVWRNNSVVSDQCQVPDARQSMSQCPP